MTPEVLKGLPRYGVVLTPIENLIEIGQVADGEFLKFSDVEKALGGWVSVEDKPEQNRRVIVLLDNGCVEDHAMFYGDNTFRYIDQITNDITPHVVKWQYLPSPPKETA